MKRILLCLISTLLLTSCATVLHKDTYFINIQSDATDAKVEVEGRTYALPAYVKVARSNQDLNLTLVSNSNQIPFKTKRMLTPTFKYWNLIGLYWAPFAYLADLTNNKRFYYGNSLWLNSKDSILTVINKKDSRYSYSRKSIRRLRKSYPPEESDSEDDPLWLSTSFEDGREPAKREHVRREPVRREAVRSEPIKQPANGRRN